eukprot:s459_g13.t1
MLVIWRIRKTGITYNAALSVCGCQEQWAHSLQLLEHFPAEHWDVITFVEAIKTAEKSARYASPLTPRVSEFMADLQTRAVCDGAVRKRCYAGHVEKFNPQIGPNFPS